MIEIHVYNLIHKNDLKIYNHSLQFKNQLVEQGINTECISIIDGNKEKSLIFFDKVLHICKMKPHGSDIVRYFCYCLNYICRHYYKMPKRDFLFLDIEIRNKLDKIQCQVQVPKYFLIYVSNKYKIKNKRGDFLPYRCGSAIFNVALCRIKNKKLIYHELAHMFNADDHYDEDSKKCSYYKKNKLCLMGINSTVGEDFCPATITRIKRYLKQNEND